MPRVHLRGCRMPERTGRPDSDLPGAMEVEGRPLNKRREPAAFTAQRSGEAPPAGAKAPAHFPPVSTS